jgi:hypothetical protein
MHCALVRSQGELFSSGAISVRGSNIAALCACALPVW